jgi:hypothetical protein
MGQGIQASADQDRLCRPAKKETTEAMSTASIVTIRARPL